MLLKDFLYQQNANKSNLESKTGLWSRSVGQLSDQSYVVNWDYDSVYLIDLGELTAVPIFQPGSETLDIRVGCNGMVSIFSPGCYKFYVLWPGHSSKSHWPFYILSSLLLFAVILFTFIKLKK